jgi:hypothetical protein
MLGFEIVQARADAVAAGRCSEGRCSDKAVFNQLADPATLKLAREAQPDEEPVYGEPAYGAVFSRFLAPREALALAQVDERCHVLSEVQLRVQLCKVCHVCSRSVGLSEFALARLGFYTDLTLVPGDDLLELDLAETGTRTGLYAADRVRVLRGPLGLSDITIEANWQSHVARLGAQSQGLFLGDGARSSTGRSLTRLACEMRLALTLLQPGGSAVLRLPGVLLVSLSAVELLLVFTRHFASAHVCVLSASEGYLVAVTKRDAAAESDLDSDLDTLARRAVVPEIEPLLDWDAKDPDLEALARQVADLNGRVAAFLVKLRALRKARDADAEALLRLACFGPSLPSVVLTDFRLCPQDLRSWLRPMVETLPGEHLLLVRPGPRDQEDPEREDKTSFVFVSGELELFVPDGSPEDVRRLVGDLSSCVAPGMVLHVVPLDADVGLTRLKLVRVMATADQPFLWREHDRQESLLDLIKNSQRPQALVSLE